MLVEMEALHDLSYRLPFHLHFIPPGCGLIEIPVKLEAANNLLYRLPFQLHFTPPG